MKRCVHALQGGGSLADGSGHVRGQGGSSVLLSDLLPQFSERGTIIEDRGFLEIYPYIVWNDKVRLEEVAGLVHFRRKKEDRRSCSRVALQTIPNYAAGDTFEPKIEVRIHPLFDNCNTSWSQRSRPPPVWPLRA